MKTLEWNILLCFIFGLKLKSCSTPLFISVSNFMTLVKTVYISLTCLKGIMEVNYLFYYSVTFYISLVIEAKKGTTKDDF